MKIIKSEDFAGEDRRYYWWRRDKNQSWHSVLYREGKILICGITKQYTVEDLGGEYAEDPIEYPVIQSTESVLTEIAFSSVYRTNGKDIDLTDAIIRLAQEITDEKETNWEMTVGEVSLSNFVIGAYWSLTEWHGGQNSETYRALSMLGDIFTPGMSSPPTEEESEYQDYCAINQYYSKQ